MNRRIVCSLFCSLILTLLYVSPADAQSDKAEKIVNALSAAHPPITDNATVKDWPSEDNAEFTVLREGSNGWTCFPDSPGTPGNDPMCVDQPWLDWIDAWVNKKEVSTTRMGFGYMLQANDSPYSNTDPYFEGQTPDNEWQQSDVPHLMIIVPDAKMLEGLSTSPDNAGPWVMWRDTPYVHIMAPMPLYVTGNK